MSQQQGNLVPAPGLDGPEQLVGQHRGPGLLGLAQPAAPRSAVALTEPVVEQQPEMVVAGLEHLVVELLPVVGITPASSSNRPG
jgi:hypothetical protein